MAVVVRLIGSAHECGPSGQAPPVLLRGAKHVGGRAAHPLARRRNRWGSPDDRGSGPPLRSGRIAGRRMGWRMWPSRVRMRSRRPAAAVQRQVGVPVCGCVSLTQCPGDVSREGQSWHWQGGECRLLRKQRLKPEARSHASSVPLFAFAFRMLHHSSGFRRSLGPDLIKCCKSKSSVVASAVGRVSAFTLCVVDTPTGEKSRNSFCPLSQNLLQGWALSSVGFVS